MPDDTFTSSKVIDLGGRAVEMVHPGRGHTAGDLVVRAPDAEVLLSGDLVEESAPPPHGSDCFPRAWHTHPRHCSRPPDGGHGGGPGAWRPVGRGFVEQQREAVGLVALTVRDLASRGAPAAEALAATSWP